MSYIFRIEPSKQIADILNGDISQFFPENYFDNEQEVDIITHGQSNHKESQGDKGQEDTHTSGPQHAPRRQGQHHRRHSDSGIIEHDSVLLGQGGEGDTLQSLGQTQDSGGHSIHG